MTVFKVEYRLDRNSAYMQVEARTHRKAYLKVKDQLERKSIVTPILSTEAMVSPEPEAA